MYVRRLGPSTILYQRTAKDTLHGCRNPHGGGQRPELLAVSQYLEVRIASFKCGATGHVVAATQQQSPDADGAPASLG